MNVSSGATAELVRKEIGEILPLPLLKHGSVVCPSSLISDSLNTCEIFMIKKTSRQKTNHMAIPSLQKTGSSEPMSDISGKDACKGISVSVVDSRTATEFASEGEPLYLNPVGPLFNGEGTLEASLNELDITDLEDEKSFSSQISLPTSMMSSMNLWT
jgi:hypothetical protein